ncbi:MAG TPA: hypothetical protein VF384_06200 [Planctomycetota bacterium]
MIRLLGWMLVWLMSVSVASAQITWNSIPAAPNTGAMAFDTWRQRLVSVGNGSTYEFDGTAWTQIPGAGSPYAIGWIAFDSVQGRTLVGAFMPGPPDLINVWAWDGVSWTSSLPQPTFLFNLGHVTSHPEMGLVFTYQDPLVSGLALYSWNGAWLTLLPTGMQLPPTRAGIHNNYYIYHSMTSEPTTGKLVLFGRTEFMGSGIPIATEAITWEWDAVNGWANLGSSGTLAGGVFSVTTIWFDAHRGKVMRLDTYPGGHNAFMRTATGGWAAFPLQAPSTGLVFGVGSDPYLNRFYGVGLLGLGYYADVYPAKLEVHGLSCPPSTTNPFWIWLTQPSSRPWIGGTLSVDIGATWSPLPTPFAFLATGFGDQTFQGVPLPISLASIGMPSCTLNIDPAVTAAVPVSGGVGTATLPIPMSMGLVGVQFFQQAFAVWPGANPLNLLATPSNRYTIGRSH